MSGQSGRAGRLNHDDALAAENAASAWQNATCAFFPHAFEDAIAGRQ
jgi:hypothetical protein